MVSVLPAGDVTRLKGAAEVLLSPFDYPDLPQWTAAMVRAIEALFHADWVLCAVTAEKRKILCTESVPEGHAAIMHSVLPCGGPRHPEGMDRSAALRTGVRIAKGVDAQENTSLDTLAGEALCRCVDEGQTTVPDGLSRFVSLRAASASGQAELVWGCSDPGHRPFAEEEELEVAAMLLPAYRAGVLLAQRRAPVEEEVISALDRLGVAAFVLDSQGRVLEVTSRLESLLHLEPEEDQLRAAAQQLARRIVTLRRSRDSSSSAAESPAACLELTTRAGGYSLRGAFAPWGRNLPPFAVIVSVQWKRAQVLPSSSDLVIQQGLTPREAEVALLLAKGCSDKEIGDTLAISHHTARKHAEHIFQKLHVHTRKAIALKLMSP